MSRQRHYLEQSDYCEKCLQETDISELHLPTGVCTSCRRKEPVKRLTEKDLAKAFNILREVLNVRDINRE